MDSFYQNLPASGPARERLRVKGQFWTPAWIAEAMVGYVLAGGSSSIFDPAVGDGAFFRATKNIVAETDRTITLLGSEIDPQVLQQARHNNLDDHDLANVQQTHFVRNPPPGPYHAIVANPPYIRHHRLSPTEKAELKTFAYKTLGFALDGRAGLHIYFLLRALQLLEKNGRLAFILPADTCEGVFAPAFWQWITHRFRLDAVVTFAPEASPFPKVDTNPLIFLIKNTRPDTHFLWARCMKTSTPELKAWMLSDLQDPPGTDIPVHRRNLNEGLATGFSRACSHAPAHGPLLADFARVQRGVATGANHFFFLTRQQVEAAGISQDFLQFAIGRTRDVPDSALTTEGMHRLAQKDRPTLLFCPDGRPLDQFPLPIQAYIKRGEELGIHKKPLISTRRPWYKMEQRAAPPFLFAYLGRRNARFIRNEAGVIPLTVFLCVYPHSNDPSFIENLWQVLQHPDTVANLRLVGKSYGAGAIKVEPRALERLPLPAEVVQRVFGAFSATHTTTIQPSLPLMPDSDIR